MTIPSTPITLEGQDGHDDHVCEVDLAFEFLNTRELEDGRLVDRLASAEDALAWLTEHDLVHADTASAERSRLATEPARAALALDRVRRTRDALRELSDAVVEGRRPDAAAVGIVNGALRARPADELVLDGDEIRLAHGHAADPFADALVRIAEPIVHEIGAGHPERLRVCANDTCRWVFFDSSRAGRRRWCDMTTCGNRAKAARHRARRRAAAN